MGNDWAAVHNDPFAIAFTFGAGLGEAGFFHGLLHAGRQRLGLAVGRTRRHNHALKQRRQVFGIEHLDILRLHVLQAVNDGTLQLGDVFLGGGVGWFFGGGHQLLMDEEVSTIARVAVIVDRVNTQ